MNDRSTHNPHSETDEVLVAKDGKVERHTRVNATDMVQHLGWRFEQTANLPPKSE
jgi:hypothetical protein